MSWKVLKLPASAQVGDLLGRPEGAPLFPEQLSAEWMQEIEQIDPLLWRSMYQQEGPAATSPAPQRWWERLQTWLWRK